MTRVERNEDIVKREGKRGKDYIRREEGREKK